MATAARLRANRKNSIRSTGPLTQAGKAKIAVNAVKGGIHAKALVVVALGESAEEFEQFRISIVADLEPDGAVERELADRVAVVMWRHRRAVRYETAAMNCLPPRLPRHPDQVDYREGDPTVPLPPNAPTNRRLADVRNRLFHARFLLESLQKAAIVASDLAELPAVEMVNWRVTDLILAAAGELLGWHRAHDEPDHWAVLATELGFDSPRTGCGDWGAGQLRDLVFAAVKSCGHDPEPFLGALSERISEELTEPEQSVSRLEAEEQELADRMLREREAAAGAPAFAERGVVERVIRVEAHLSRELHRTLTMLHGMQGRREEPRGTAWAAGVLVGLPNGVVGDGGSRNGFDLQKRPRLSVGSSAASLVGEEAPTEGVTVASMENGG